MFDGSVNVVSPGAYAVSDGGGDISSDGQGLFYRDTRHLARFVLRVNGEVPVALGSWTRGSEAGFASRIVGGEDVWVERRRVLGGGMDEEVLLSNDSREAVKARVEIECTADFKDVFEVRGYHEGAERGELVEEAEDGVLRFAYRHGEFQRGTVVRVSGEGVEALAEPGRISLEVLLEPEATCAVGVSVSLEEGGREVRWTRRPEPLYGGAPSLETGWGALRRSWEKSVKDLEALSFEAEEGLLVPAAGAPWYMALFGRDALITAFQTMPLTPEPAKNTLRALARYQAGGFDDFRDAEPGKVLHELRFGELAFFGEIPHSPYYGTVDATLLFLILPRSRARPE